jgi:hypothetical protein
VLSLSEQVLQRVQRVGLALTSAASAVEPSLRDHLLARVGELDDVTRAVRDTVFPRWSSARALVVGAGESACRRPGPPPHSSPQDDERRPQRDRPGTGAGPLPGGG